MSQMRTIDVIFITPNTMTTAKMRGGLVFRLVEVCVWGGGGGGGGCTQYVSLLSIRQCISEYQTISVWWCTLFGIMKHECL